MEKEFVPYAESLALKQLGFDEPSVSGFSYPDSDNLLTQAILYQQAFRWFREKYDIKISIDYKSTDEICYFFRISFQRLANGENPPVMVWHHCNSWLGLNMPLSTYEEAELACLRKLIEILKTKQ